MNIPENKYLGSLCKRGHDWNGTGKSLKYILWRHCCECEKERAKTKIKKDKAKEWGRKYYQEHKSEFKKRSRLHHKRYRENLNYKLSKNIPKLIRLSLKGDKNGCHWENLVGYTLSDLKKHLEKQFTEGMTWENYGEWHIDHIIPKSMFNFSKPEHLDFKRCWALKNLQPLWKEENRTKHNKLIQDFQPSLAL